MSSPESVIDGSPSLLESASQAVSPQELTDWLIEPFELIKNQADWLLNPAQETAWPKQQVDQFISQSIWLPGFSNAWPKGLANGSVFYDAQAKTGFSVTKPPNSLDEHLQADSYSYFKQALNKYVNDYNLLGHNLSATPDSLKPVYDLGLYELLMTYAYQAGVSPQERAPVSQAEVEALFHLPEAQTGICLPAFGLFEDIIDYEYHLKTLIQSPSADGQAHPPLPALAEPLALSQASSDQLRSSGVLARLQAARAKVFERLESLNLEPTAPTTETDQPTLADLIGVIGSNWRDLSFKLRLMNQAMNSATRTAHQPEFQLVLGELAQVADMYQVKEQLLTAEVAKWPLLARPLSDSNLQPLEYIWLVNKHQQLARFLRLSEQPNQQQLTQTLTNLVSKQDLLNQYQLNQLQGRFSPNRLS